jgi:hypothetical protein
VILYDKYERCVRYGFLTMRGARGISCGTRRPSRDARDEALSFVLWVQQRKAAMPEGAAGVGP